MSYGIILVLGMVIGWIINEYGVRTSVKWLAAAFGAIVTWIVAAWEDAQSVWEMVSNFFGGAL